MLLEFEDTSAAATHSVSSQSPYFCVSPVGLFICAFVGSWVKGEHLIVSGSTKPSISQETMASTCHTDALAHRVDGSDLGP